MRSSIRVMRGVAFLAAVGVVQLTGCLGGGGDDAPSEKVSVGSVKVALQTMSRSGNVYRLHAIFSVQDVKTGNFVTSLSSEQDGTFAPEVSTELPTGDFMLRIEQGWELELVSSNGGSAGSPGVGGAPPVPPIGAAGSVSKGLPPILPREGFPFLSAFEGGAGGASGDPTIGGSPMVGGSFPFPTAGTGGRPPFPNGGSGVGGSFPIPGSIVPAQLVNNAIQPFSLFGGDSALITYQFRVGDEVIDFTRGRLRIDFTVDDTALCIPPSTGIDQDRVVMEHSVDALTGLRVLDVFRAIADNEGHATDPLLLYQQLIDSYATAAEGRLGPEAAHCGDEQTDGQPTLNGYPIRCNRRERFHFDDTEAWFATAFVNRMDLAPQNGAHCGQQRMIFANNTQGRMFIIFESQIPNPRPDLGIQGCLPLAEFWLAQNGIPDAKLRGENLRTAFLSGHPDLVAQGFGPFFSASNFTVGSGQLRTNQFDDSPWTLREFKLALDREQLKVLPFPVGESPNGGLWDENANLPAGEACRENFVGAATAGLLGNDLSEMSFVVDKACMNSESQNDFSEDYDSRMSPGFRAQLDQTFAPFGLTGSDVANRAQFAGSCIGCHSEASNRRLGGGLIAPPSPDFVQVSERLSLCDNELCFPLSPGLESVFLPRRLRALTDLLGLEPPPNPCDSGGGTDGAPGTGGAAGFGAGGPSPAAGRGGRNGSGGSPNPPPSSGEAGEAFGGAAGEEPVIEPAPEIEITIPQASVPVEQLQADDARIRESYGEKTLGGKDARVTH